MSLRAARTTIESAKNPHVKELMRLATRRGRDASGVTLVEGAREVRRAMQAGLRIRELLLEPTRAGEEGERLASDAVQVGTRVMHLSTPAFQRLSMRQRPDGVLAVVEVPKRFLDDVHLPEDGLVLVATSTEKPGNLGALFRTADAVGAQAVLVAEEPGSGGSDVWNPNVIRASMGSVFHVPTASASGAELRAFLEAQEIRVITAEPEAKTSYWDATLTGRVAIVVGAEHAGVPTAWSEVANERVSIPMHGAADSLNVSVSGALLLYEALRQRRGS